MTRLNNDVTDNPGVIGKQNSVNLSDVSVGSAYRIVPNCIVTTQVFLSLWRAMFCAMLANSDRT